MKTVIKKLDGTDYVEKEYKQIGNTQITVKEKVVTVGDIISRVAVAGMKDTEKAMDIWKACEKAQEEGIDALEVEEGALILNVVKEMYTSPLIQARMHQRLNKKDGVQKKE